MSKWKNALNLFLGSLIGLKSVKEIFVKKM